MTHDLQSNSFIVFCSSGVCHLNNMLSNTNDEFCSSECVHSLQQGLQILSKVITLAGHQHILKNNFTLGSTSSLKSKSFSDSWSQLTVIFPFHVISSSQLLTTVLSILCYSSPQARHHTQMDVHLSQYFLFYFDIFRLFDSPKRHVWSLISPQSI